MPAKLPPLAPMIAQLKRAGVKAEGLTHEAVAKLHKATFPENYRTWGKAAEEASNKSLIMEFMSPQKITDAAMGIGRGGRGKRKA